MIDPLVLDIIHKLRTLYPSNDRVSELFLKIGQVSHFPPRLLTGSKSVFPLQKQGSRLVKAKELLDSLSIPK